MNVFLTIDVETYTGNYELDINGYGKGLPFILELLNRFEVKGTFFIEALGATRWGTSALKNICLVINGFGHSIQLHTHPKVAEVEGINTRDDQMWKYDVIAQKKLLEEGIRILNTCGCKKTIAFRAGDLAADKNTLEAMEKVGLPISSNRDLDLKSTIHTKINDLFPINNDLSQRRSVIDLPITSFRSPLPFLDGAYRHLEICALGELEMVHGLLAMAKAGYSCATILTHPGEFFMHTDNKTHFINKNCQRLESLLRFLCSRDEFEVLPIDYRLLETKRPVFSRSIVRLNLRHSLLRVMEQGLKRL